MPETSPSAVTSNIKLIIAYDGTDYAGWQRQDGKKVRTVQGEIEKALETIHKHPVALAGSGRTDSGVHARGQAASFYSDIAGMDAARFVPALNGLLPRSIRIMEACSVPEGFHARFDARSRTYRYFFVAGRQALPHERRYALQLWHRPGIARLNSYCRFLRGELDCSVFASPRRDPDKSRNRYIYEASFFAEGDKLVFEIRANAFLWKMVRSAGGTLLFYEKEGISPDEFKTIFTSGKRNLAGPTLPPEGLFLWTVGY